MQCTGQPGETTSYYANVTTYCFLNTGVLQPGVCGRRVVGVYLYGFCQPTEPEGFPDYDSGYLLVCQIQAFGRQFN